MGMVRRSYRPEQIIKKLRKAEVLLSLVSRLCEDSESDSVGKNEVRQQYSGGWHMFCLSRTRAT